MRRPSIVVTFTVLAVLAVLGVIIGVKLSRSGIKIPGFKTEECTATADGVATLDLDQMANAATIAAVGIRRNLPERAITIAIATAFQESKLHNLSGGDRDSIGLFQQRPSQGWGTEEEIADPRYAAKRFYQALLRVKGWQSMSVTAAAQSVQRSAVPDAYQQWAEESSVIARAFLGDVSRAVACRIGDSPASRGTKAVTGLHNLLRGDWGDAVAIGAISDPNAVALAVPDNRAGWQYAHWLVAHAQGTGVMRVRFGSQQWTAKSGAWGRAGDPETPAPGETVVAEVYGSA